MGVRYYVLYTFEADAKILSLNYLGLLAKQRKPPRHSKHGTVEYIYDILDNIFFRHINRYILIT